MIEFRKSKDRGYFDHGWLKTYHSFSFADYQDPNFMSFRKLRVINEDFVAEGNGFGTHSHRDMEIITYVLSGKLSHKDSMGNGSTILPGDAQFMSAGSGVTHSEFNHSKEEPVHLLQIWILPSQKGITPSYAQKHYPEHEKLNRLCLIVSGSGRDGSIKIGQDVDLYASILDKDQIVLKEFKKDRFAYVQLIKGNIRLNDMVLSPGDGAMISEETKVKVQAVEKSELLVFDLA